VEPPAQEERARLGDVLPAAALAELYRAGVPRGYVFGDLGLIEAGGPALDPIEAFADALVGLEDGDRLHAETLRRQLDEGSLFVAEDEEMPGGGAPLSA
jgi:hypothetical protein